MEAKLHFISGLPRSGSTLLAALLRQNGRVYASMSGPVGGLLNTLLGEMSARNEYAVFLTDEQRRRILRGLFDSYYDAGFGAEVVFDTNRLWCSKLALLAELFPESRVIACVRHVPWVIDSIERLVQRNVLQPSSIFSHQPGGTVYSRAEGVAGGNGLVGFAHNALKQAYYGEHTDRLMLLRYDTLTGNPQRALAAVYDFIGEPAFEHDFEHVEFDAEAFDAKAGTPGLHHIRPKVERTERTTILPPDLFRRYENDSFWLNPAMNLRGVRVV